MTALPRWVNLGLLPALNLLAALLVSGLVVVALGEDPWRALRVLVVGSFGSQEAIGYTLYYATNLVFTGLAVAIAFHAGLFNIGGEGQAYIGGLGVGLACLMFDWLPWPLLLPVALLGGMAFGAAWAYVPGWLQARRGSHIVITTIMFNFIASALMVYLMVEWLIRPGQMSPESREFADAARLPFLHDFLPIARSPANISILLAVAASLFVWLLVWRTRWGFELRTVGTNEPAAVYAGMDPARVMIWAMALSGGLASLVGINVLMGEQHRILLNFHEGYGYTGIAVALMGRNHPVGIALAALLFGALYQGGGELSFEMQRITRDMVVLIQGLVILFAGALENLFRPALVRLFVRS